MFDLGWTELLLIGIVALIVVGPKDLPVLFRNVGRFVGKAKAMAREFTRAMEEAADEAGVKDVSKTFKDATNPGKLGLDKLKEATDFSKWEPGSATGKLAEDRAEAAKKIHAATAARAATRPSAMSPGDVQFLACTTLSIRCQKLDMDGMHRDGGHGRRLRLIAPIAPSRAAHTAAHTAAQHKHPTPFTIGVC